MHACEMVMKWRASVRGVHGLAPKDEPVVVEGEGSVGLTIARAARQRRRLGAAHFLAPAQQQNPPALLVSTPTSAARGDAFLLLHPLLDAPPPLHLHPNTQPILYASATHLCCTGGMPSFSSTRSLMRCTVSVGSMSISISFPVSVLTCGVRVGGLEVKVED